MSVQREYLWIAEILTPAAGVIRRFATGEAELFGLLAEYVSDLDGEIPEHVPPCQDISDRAQVDWFFANHPEDRLTLGKVLMPQLNAPHLPVEPLNPQCDVERLEASVQLSCPECGNSLRKYEQVERRWDVLGVIPGEAIVCDEYSEQVIYEADTDHEPGILECSNCNEEFLIQDLLDRAKQEEEDCHAPAS